MSLFNKIINSPVITIAWVTFVELLIRQGFLYEAQREKWLMDGSTLILEAGIVFMLTSYAHHKFDLHKQKKLADHISGITPDQETAMNVMQLMGYIKTAKDLFIKRTPQQ